MLSIKRFLIIFHLFLLFLSSVATVQSAPSDVDPGFNPKLTIDPIYANGDVVIQPDGKILVFGTYFFKRLNTDGTIDPTFDCAACLSFTPNSVAVQPDGKILIGGQTRVIRVTQTGSLDITFNTRFSGIGGCQVSELNVQPDGKVLFGCDTVTGSTAQIRRLNPDGTFDLGFNPIVFNSSRTVYKVLLLPDGRFLGAGKNVDANSGWMQRYNSDGTIDSSFQTDISASVSDIGLTIDGKYLIVGDFSSVNGFTRNRIAKLSADGSLDSGFTITPPAGTVITLKILSNGQFYIQSYIVPTTTIIYNFTRYNPNGSVDNTFTSALNRTEAWAVDDSNRIVTLNESDPNRRYFRLNIDGSIDFSFASVLYSEGGVTAATMQNDGKILVGGNFSKANGIAMKSLARLNPDGTTDTTFNPDNGLNGNPNEIAVQTDGKILVGGEFSNYNGVLRTKLARINADGTLDTTFNPTLSSSNEFWSVYAITPTADGKILVGGNFTTVNGVNQTGVARLNADGSLDTSFTPPTLNATAITDVISVLPNGQFLVGGNGTLYRLNSNGTRDTSFNLVIGGRISQVLPQPDGKYLIAYSANVTYALFRCNNDGSFDFSFRFISDTNTTANTFYQQPNGNIVIGGNIRSRNIMRVGPTGQRDYYSFKYGANGTVHKILPQADGKLLVFGTFNGIEDNLRSGIARISLKNSFNLVPFDFDGDGRSDVSVFRPSVGGWYALNSSNSSLFSANFGSPTDQPIAADYDSDGKTDVAVFRDGNWYVIRSFDNTFAANYFGQSGDIPVAGDIDGDWKSDRIVFRNGTWYLSRSSNGTLDVIQFGNANDIPMTGDFDGDSFIDLILYRPSEGKWYRLSLLNNQTVPVNFGTAEDKPISADFDGDGKTDIAVFRPSVGDWYWLNSSDGSFSGLYWGTNGDKPVPADYDGDGKTDIAVFRPSDGTWYILQSTAGFKAVNWGLSTDIPIPNAYIR